MRFVFVTFVVLTASFTFATTPTATVDPEAALNKIDMSRPPPPPAPVYVLNFPETQAVEGTVAVSNLPAVQTVGGTVSVGNLPLAEDGSLRIKIQPFSKTFDLLDTVVTLPSGEGWTSNWVASGEYSTVVLAIIGSSIDCTTTWRFAPTDVGGWGAGPSVGRNFGGGNIGIGGVLGPELQVQCSGASSGSISDVRVFLRK